MKVPLHVVAGHLGAGKTTLLAHLLARRPPGERVGVVVNDFGDAAIDAALLGLAGGTTREIRGSCVCCTAPEGFSAAVAELLPTVDRLFVEPTGLAHPADLVDTVRRAPWADRVELRPVIVVVDPGAFARGEVPEGFAEQLGIAEILVVNRVDRATDEEVAALRGRVSASWPGPDRTLEVAFGRVPDDVLDPGSDRPAGHHPHDHAHHHHEARSFVFPPEQVFRRDTLERWLRETPLARAKGLFRTDEGWCVAQRAGDSVTFAPTAWRADSRVDLIASGQGLLGDAEARLREAFAPAPGPDTVELAWPGGSRTFDRAALAGLADGVSDVSTLFPKRSGAGARLSRVLEAAGVPTAGTLVASARDGYVSAPTPLADALAGVLVFSPGPGVRLLVPGEVPCANVKDVVRLVVR